MHLTHRIKTLGQIVQLIRRRVWNTILVLPCQERRPFETVKSSVPFEVTDSTLWLHALVT